jgi:aminopeptidase YwaD
MRILALALTLALVTPAVAETRRIPFWPDAVPAAIQKHVDGGSVLGAVRSLGRYHRVQGSPGFRAATEWLVGELTGGGLADGKSQMTGCIPTLPVK